MKIIKLKDYKNIYSVNTLLSEFKDLFRKSIDEYTNCLEKERVNLKILDQEGLAKALSYNQFEKLENENLYSIRYVSKQNPRIIFACVKNERVILLSCCKENRKSDYAHAISLAKQRLREMEE